MNGTGIISKLGNWAGQPFSAQMDLWNWVLFTVVIVSVGVIWTRVLHHITEE